MLNVMTTALQQAGIKYNISLPSQDYDITWQITPNIEVESGADDGYCLWLYAPDSEDSMLMEFEENEVPMLIAVLKKLTAERI